MNEEYMMQVLLSPHVSEKSTMVADANRQHVFKVLSTASKQDVKQAVERLFNVKVDAVQLIKVKGKTKRMQQELGRRSDWKKAYVRLAEGHDIDFGAGD